MAGAPAPGKPRVVRNPCDSLGCMTPAELADVLLAAVRRAVESGALDADVPAARCTSSGPGSASTATTRPTSRCSWPRPPAARRARSPRSSPRRIVERRRGSRAVDVAGPGLPQHHPRRGRARRAGAHRSSRPARRLRPHRRSAASARSTWSSSPRTRPGPMHLGGARWAAVGDSLARVLQATGADVAAGVLLQRPGAQIDRFARSLLAPRARRAGARGRLRRRVHRRDRRGGRRRASPDVLDLPDDEAQEVFRARGRRADVRRDQAQPARLRRRLRRLLPRDRAARVRARSSARSSGCASAATSTRRTARSGCGPPTSATTRTGCVVKSDGEPTYFSGDIAYYLDKRERGFDDRDHLAGRRPPRLHRPADGDGARRFGDDPDENLEILIGQLVNLVKDGEPVRMSKRAGNVVTLDDLVEAVGVDAARYALARSSVDSTLDIDLDLLTRQTSDNPVFYVQYAHARIASLAAQRRRRRRRRCGDDFDAGAARRTSGRATCCAALGEFPRVVAERGRAARAAPRRPLPRGAGRHLPPLLRRLPRAARRRRRADRPTEPDPRAGCWLCEATRTVLANGLGLLGVTAPGADVSRDRPPALEPVGLAGSAATTGPTTACCTARRASRSPTWPASSAPRLLLLDEADFRARAAHWRAGVRRRPTSTTPARRSSAPRSRAGSPRRASASTSAPAASWPSRCAPASRRSGSRSTATTSRSPSCAARSTPASAGSSSTRYDGDRAARRRRGARRPAASTVMVRVTAGVEAHTHEYIATAHEDQKFGFSLAGGAAAKAVARSLGRPALRAGRAARAHRLADLRHRGLRGRRAPHGRPARRGPRRARRRARRARPRRRPRHRLHRRATTRWTVEDFADALRDHRRDASAAAAGIAVPRLSVEPGRAIAGPDDLTLYEVGTVKDRSPGAAAPTSSVDGGMSDNIRTALYGADYTARAGQPDVRRAAARCHAWSASTARAATSWSATSGCRPTSRPATCSPCRHRRLLPLDGQQLQPRRRARRSSP